MRIDDADKRQWPPPIFGPALVPPLAPPEPEFKKKTAWPVRLREIAAARRRPGFNLACSRKCEPSGILWPLLATKRIVMAKACFFVGLPAFFRRNQSSQTGPFPAKRLLRGLWNKKITHHRLAFPFDLMGSLREHGDVWMFLASGVLNEMSRRLIGGHEQR
jgi:hypothetical protein